MKKSFKQRILFTTLASAILTSSSSMAMAANEPKNAQSAVTLSVGGVILSASVPAELPIRMDLSGNLSVPTDAVILNNVEDRDIAVTDISIDLEKGWKAAAYSDNFKEKADNAQEIALKFRSDELQADGSFPLTANDWIIGKGGSLPLHMKPKYPNKQ